MGENDARSTGERTFPGGRTPSVAWHGFETRLAEVLGALEEDQFLVISVKRRLAYVQFAAHGSFGLRAESVSNHFLSEADKFSADQITVLNQLGWKSPTGTPREATSKRQPDGSPNFFRDFDRPVPVGEVARLAVRTLTDVFGLSHPGGLDYQAFDRSERFILLPTLGLMRRPPAPPPADPPADTVEEIRIRVLEVIRKAADNPEIEFSEDGHVALRFGSAIVFVRVHKKPFCVSLTSPILVNVETKSPVMDRLNELNARVRFARFFLKDGTVYAVVEVSAAPFVAQHVIDACGRLGSLADEIDDMLQEELGGRTALGEFRSSVRVH